MEGPSNPDNFFNFLKSWGSEWMWINIVNKENGLQWVVESDINGIAVWIMDGSYHKDVIPVLSRAGWIIFGTQR